MSWASVALPPTCHRSTPSSICCRRYRGSPARNRALLAGISCPPLASAVPARPSTRGGTILFPPTTAGPKSRPLTSLQPTPVRTCRQDGECHGLARRAHALCRLVVDGRPADAGGDARADARRHRAVAGGEPAGGRPARARAVLFRQPPHHVPDPGDRRADRDLVPAAAPYPPQRAGGVRRQPRVPIHDPGLRC